jgi:hypothetical protein
MKQDTPHSSPGTTVMAVIWNFLRIVAAKSPLSVEAIKHE